MYAPPWTLRRCRSGSTCWYDHSFEMRLSVSSIAEVPRDTSTVAANGEAGATLVGRFDAHSRVQEGGAVDAVVDTSSLHFFDPQTGNGIYGIDAGTAGEPDVHPS